MPDAPSASVIAKYVAAKYACGFIKDGMNVGLGTGSTAEWMVKYLAAQVKQKAWHLKCVPTSSRTMALAQGLGLNVTSLEQVKRLDITIDGADEVDQNLNLIKGGGGALLQEKIVATSSDNVIIIADSAKMVASLGTFPLPIEVVRFGWQSTQHHIAQTLKAQGYKEVTLARRIMQGAPYKTDEGHYIIDAYLNKISDAPAVSHQLNQIAGVVENGLFINICQTAIIGDAQGRVQIYGRDGAAYPPQDISYKDDTILYT